MRHIISILLQNEAGALTRVAGLFSTRGYNIESLNVAPTDDPTVSRLTLVTTGTDAVIHQIVNQLLKLVDVVNVDDMTRDHHVERELLLMKVALTPKRVEAFRAAAAEAGAKVLHDELDSYINTVKAKPGGRIAARLRLLRLRTWHPGARAPSLAMFRLYDYLPSGNGYKVRLVLKQLDLPYELVELDIKQGATRTAEFLAKNPNGRIPLLEIDGAYLAESHAIIAYLAAGSLLVPEDRLERARMWQWLCFEQYNLEPNIGTARYWLRSLGRTAAELGERLAEKRRNGAAALAVLEQGLEGREFLVTDRLTLADIALYAYTHVAPEAGFDLDPCPRIRAWLHRLQSLPRWAPITAR